MKQDHFIFVKMCSGGAMGGKVDTEKFASFLNPFGPPAREKFCRIEISIKAVSLMRPIHIHCKLACFTYTLP